MAKLRIAVPDNPLFDDLIASAAAAYDIEPEIIRCTEPQARDLLVNARVDVALLSPLTYAESAIKSDLRVIPATCVSINGYSGVMSLYFRQGLRTIGNCSLPCPDDFLTLAGKIVLKEKFDVDPEYRITKDNPTDVLQGNDSAIARGNSHSHEISLDVSEEWFDLFDISLLAGFWACRTDHVPDNLANFIKSMIAADLARFETINEDEPFEYEYQRSGEMYFYWQDDVENSLEQTMEMLYYHLYVPEIAAVKILGRD